MGNCCPKSKHLDSEDEPQPKKKGERKGWRRRRRHQAGKKNQEQESHTSSPSPNIITVMAEINQPEGEDLEEDSPNHDDAISPDVTDTAALDVDILSTEAVVLLERTPQPEEDPKLEETEKDNQAEISQIVPGEDHAETTSLSKALVMTPFAIEPNEDEEELHETEKEEDQAENTQIVDGEDHVEKNALFKALVMTPLTIEPDKEDEEGELDETEKEEDQAENTQMVRGEDSVEKTSHFNALVMTPFTIEPKKDNDEEEELNKTEEEDNQFEKAQMIHGEDSVEKSEKEEKQVENAQAAHGEESVEKTEQEKMEVEKVKIGDEKEPKSILLPVIKNPPYNLYRLKQDLDMLHEYGKETYRYKMSREEKFMAAECLRHQTGIDETDRCTMVRHICMISAYFKLDFECLCVALNLMDRLLLCRHIGSDGYQLLANTCLLVASKYTDQSAEQVWELSTTLQKGYGRQAILDMEKNVLSNIGFDLGAPTVNFFLEYYVIEAVDSPDACEVDIDIMSELLEHARAIAKICLAEYFFCACPPSMQARYCVAVAQQRLFPEDEPMIMNQEDGLSHLINLVTQNEDYLNYLLKCENYSL